MPTVEFSVPFLRGLGSRPDDIGETFRDEREKGLSVRASKNGKLTFAVRIRIEGGDRPDRKFYKCRPEDIDKGELKKIIGMATDKKREWETKGVAVEVKGHPLRWVLATGTAMRRKGDKALGGKPKVKGLPAAWESGFAKFEGMCDHLAAVTRTPNLLDQPIENLTRADFVNLQEEEALKQDRKRGGTLTKNDYLADAIMPQRPMWANVIQVLNWAAGEGWIKPKELYGLVPDAYNGRTRFLLPGEWQIIAPLIDGIRDDGGMLLRFLLATGARLGQALGMTFAQMDPVEKITAPNGQVYETRVWRIPLQKHNVGLTLLVGESLRIVNHFKAQRETEQKDAQEKENKEAKKAGRAAKKIPLRETVFPASVIAMWAHNPGRQQRQLDDAVDSEIEGQLGIARWSRHDLRRTKATYSKYVGASQLLVSGLLSHAIPSSKATNGHEAAPVTEKYTIDDTAMEYIGTDNDIDIDDDNDVEVMMAHLRVQELFMQMERGELSPLLARIQRAMGGVRGVKTNDMRVRYKVNPALIKIKVTLPQGKSAK